MIKRENITAISGLTGKMCTEKKVRFRLVCVSVSLQRPLPAEEKVFCGERENGLEPRKK